MALNKEYSYRDFSCRSLREVDSAELSDSEIVGSSFAQRVEQAALGNPLQDVFPDGMLGVRFRRCNLDNVRVSLGNVVDGGCNRLLVPQNDGETWVVDGFGMPLQPLHRAEFQRHGLSEDPGDLPAKPVAVPVTLAAEEDLQNRAEVAADVARQAVLAAVG